MTQLALDIEVISVPVKNFKHRERGWMKWERLTIHEKINLRSWSKWNYAYLAQFLKNDTMLTENKDPKHQECHMYLDLQKIINQDKIFDARKVKRNKAA